MAQPGGEINFCFHIILVASLHQGCKINAISLAVAFFIAQKKFPALSHAKTYYLDMFITVVHSRSFFY